MHERYTVSQIWEFELSSRPEVSSENQIESLVLMFLILDKLSLNPHQKTFNRFQNGQIVPISKQPRLTAQTLSIYDGEITRCPGDIRPQRLRERQATVWIFVHLFCYRFLCVRNNHTPNSS